MGMLVPALFLVANRRLGTSGSYLHLAKAVLRRGGVETWRLWFLVGLLGGAAIAVMADYDVIHDALLFREAHLYLMMVAGIFAGVVLRDLQEKRSATRAPATGRRVRLDRVGAVQHDLGAGPL